jgi:hypothetical protein
VRKLDGELAGARVVNPSDYGEWPQNLSSVLHNIYWFWHWISSRVAMSQEHCAKWWMTGAHCGKYSQGISLRWHAGFENVEQGCCGTGLIETSVMCGLDEPFTCQDADKYVFFDSVHPSEQTYRILADHILNTALRVFLWVCDVICTSWDFFWVTQENISVSCWKHTEVLEIKMKES